VKIRRADFNAFWFDLFGTRPGEDCVWCIDDERYNDDGVSPTVTLPSGCLVSYGDPHLPLPGWPPKGRIALQLAPQKPVYVFSLTRAFGRWHSLRRDVLSAIDVDPERANL